ncbi:MAG: TlpA family protein disulfide reductase [Gammaproteobacteria bacterium]|nr:TlpA family protein disulfide reductase [Gammaproteobacteria bacterium]
MIRLGAVTPSCWPHSPHPSPPRCPRADGAVQRVDFERPGLDGAPVRLSAFRGQWVVVNFWATWCGPCIREIPLLDALHRERDDVTVIGVNFEEIERRDLEEFVDRMSISYPVVEVGAEPLVPFEPLKGLPSTFLVSPDGIAVAAKVGEVDREWFEHHLPAVGAGNGG